MHEGPDSSASLDNPMVWIQKAAWTQFTVAKRATITYTLACAVICGLPTQATAQVVRGKKPDRRVYVAPRIAAELYETQVADAAVRTEDGSESVAALVRRGSVSANGRTEHPDVRSTQAPRSTQLAASAEQLPASADNQQSRQERSLDGLVVTAIESVGTGEQQSQASDAQQQNLAPQQEIASRPAQSSAELRQVSHEEVYLHSPQSQQRLHPHDPAVGETWLEPIRGPYPGAGYESPACDSQGCDSIGCDGCGSCQGRFSGVGRCVTPSRWFGSAELLLMFRKGDGPPPLVTTGPGTDADTAGELGEDDTRVLVGNETILKDMTAGGRLKIGLWLDERHCQSLVFRGWFAGEENFDFHTDQSETPVIARPFLNASDDLDAPEQDTRLIAFPDVSTGMIDIHADSEVYGADVSVRQFWYGDLGATVDFLYGYQHMRLDENLHIRDFSREDPSVGSALIEITDRFAAENEFHGGQIGIATHYEEACWSFDGLAKVGFGSLRRSANRTGSTRIRVGSSIDVDDQGLLVRDTNSGKVDDNTFGWVPELDFTLGWHRYPRFDLTCGYHIIAMTDALQTSGMIDRRLAANLSEPPLEGQQPSADLRYETFYVQGIHFGLKYRY